MSHSFLQPVFLSKQERAELAIKRRKEEVEQQRKKMDDEREKRQSYLREAQGSKYTIIVDWDLSYLMICVTNFNHP